MSDRMIVPDLAFENQSHGHEVSLPPVSWIYLLARRLVFMKLSKLQQGAVTLVDGKARSAFGRLTSHCPLQATVTIHDPRLYLNLLLGGTVAAGDAYRQGL